MLARNVAWASAALVLAGVGWGVPPALGAEVDEPAPVEGLDAFALLLLSEGCWGRVERIEGSGPALGVGIGAIGVEGETSGYVTSGKGCDGNWCGCVMCILVFNIPVCGGCFKCCKADQSAHCNCNMPDVWNSRCTCS